ncbi:MAG: NAD(P)-dependent oxidoreductase [Pseudomonadota bacterium]
MARHCVTGSSGRIGRSILGLLARDHGVVGIDRLPAPSTDVIADICDEDSLKRAFDGCECVFHVAALHAPHVDAVPDKEFEQINVVGTEKVFRCAKQQGAEHVVLTSTTALYGNAAQEDGRTTWITEQTVPQPRTIYHRTKLAAEEIARSFASKRLRVSVIRMSRCFPEPAPLMAAYRLHRGVDARDVALAHWAAVQSQTEDFGIYNISGATPFEREDCEALKADAEAVLRQKAPELAALFDRRGWSLPQSIDRVYDPAYAKHSLGWESCFGFDEVFAQLDQGSAEVLPVNALSPGNSK